MQNIHTLKNINLNKALNEQANKNKERGAGTIPANSSSISVINKLILYTCTYTWPVEAKNILDVVPWVLPNFSLFI